MLIERTERPELTSRRTWHSFGALYKELICMLALRWKYGYPDIWITRYFVVSKYSETEIADPNIQVSGYQQC